MKKQDISEQLYEKIMECFIKALMKNGLKATTMDSLAANLQMSKRTLYEIFGNKEELFIEAQKYFHKKNAEKLYEIFSSSENIMEAIIKCILYNRDLMSNLNTEFIRDIHQANEKQDLFPKSQKQHHYNDLIEVLQRGVAEGFFRKDLNLTVQCRILSIQMEALKRTEEIFPEDISLLEIYDNVNIGFLRAISTKKGLDELEKFIPSFSSIGNNIEPSK